jgi:hypothetical protein
LGEQNSLGGLLEMMERDGKWNRRTGRRN